MITLVDQVIRNASRVPWSGTVYRSHGPTWPGDDPGGSLLTSGRWHVGVDSTSGRPVFPVLYTASSPYVATWERLRHLDQDSVASIRRGLRMAISRLEVALPSVLDLRDPAALGVPAETFLGNDYEVTQLIASAAYDEGLAGLLVPTATGVGAADGDHNVVVFFETTGATRYAFGLAAPGTAPRPGVTVSVLGVERPVLPP